MFKWASGEAAKNNPREIYAMHKYLWVLMMLPKELQTLVYGVYCFLLIRRHGIRWNGRRFEVMAFLLMIGIHLLSILGQGLGKGHIELERILGAFNICLIWIIALLVYGCTLHVRVDMDRIGRYMAYNLFIMFTLYLLAHWKPHLSFRFLDTRLLMKDDWLTTGHTKRFAAFLEFPNCVGIFCALGFPLALNHIKRKRSFVVKALFCAMAFVPVWASNSRVGWFGCAAIIGMGVLHMMKPYRRGMVRLSVLALEFVLLAVLLVYASTLDIQGLMGRVVNLRAGSNSMRMYLYTTSIQMTVQESLWIGLGIKYKDGLYPFGSHSTYIGMLYKTGVLGTLLFGIGMGYMFQKLLKNVRRHVLPLFFLMAMVVFAGMLIFEDLDGVNWFIVTFFSNMALFAHKENAQTLWGEGTP